MCKWYSLILAKVLYLCNFIKNVLHHGRSPYNFQISSKLLENHWVGLEYETFRLCDFIVMFVECFYCYPFKDKLGTKFRNLTQN